MSLYKKQNLIYNEQMECIEINNSKMLTLAEKRGYESSSIIQDKSGYEPV